MHGQRAPAASHLHFSLDTATSAAAKQQEKHVNSILRHAAHRAQGVQEQLAHAEQKVESLTHEKAELQRTATTAEERLIELKAKHELVKDVLSDRIKENDSLTTERDRLQVQKQTAQDDNHALAHQVESMRASLETAITNAATIRAERDDLRQRLSSGKDYPNVLNNLQRENNALKIASESTRKNFADLQDRWHKLDAENKSLGLQNCNLNATMEAKDKELANLRLNRQHRAKQLDNLQRANNSLKIVVQLRDKALAEASSAREAQQQSLQDDLNVKTRELNETRTRHNIILAKLEDARAKFHSAESAQRALEDDVKVLRGTVKAYQTEEDGYQKQLSAREKEKRDLAQASEEAKADADVSKRCLDEARDTHKTHIAALEQQKDSVLQELQRARERKQGAEEQLAAMECKFTSTEADNKSLRTSRDVSTDEWEQEVRKQADMKSEIECLLSKLDSAQQENGRLSQQLRNVQRAISGCSSSGDSQHSPLEAKMINAAGSKASVLATEDDMPLIASNTPAPAAIPSELMQQQTGGKEFSMPHEDHVRHKRREERAPPAFVRLVTPQELNFYEIDRVEQGSEYPPDFGASLRARYPRGHEGGIPAQKLNACPWTLSDVDLTDIDQKVRQHALRFQAAQPVRESTPFAQTGAVALDTHEGNPTSPAAIAARSSAHIKRSDSVIDVKHQPCYVVAKADSECEQSVNEARRDFRREISSTLTKAEKAVPNISSSQADFVRKRLRQDADDENLKYRKAVCRRCLWNSLECSSMGECSKCAGAGNKCFYLYCQAGLSCRNARCNFLHLEQWAGKEKGSWSAE